MRYLCVSDSRRIEADDVASLEQQLRSEPRDSSMTLRINLPISLAGTVRRTDASSPEELTLHNCSGTAKTFIRQTDHYPEGDLGVSCSPYGSEASVNSINLHFRNYNDTLTERGVVWVMPGEPAVATLTLRPDRFGESNESIADIVAAAEKTVAEKVLSHFAH